ncbi:membrane protein insertase YidC [Streptomyces albireticuli]|uniref:Membrane protein insertase YidC n=1 Tax=Streptomyces albireticuli TaxID=1940 RepID=A0A2A2CZV5_9ACTN|nr:membrane protein insertase YidC [Streptomyces albireticuli]MCD9141554.1 YidC/Oxa1 family membrane protein insertase [Streptomyces albireticuli]MCD9164195.1 YidC/Oxa1 family membrane protein insertase [Streptomyces albireticuli]MCD9189728.1 YidC/Oxa1 family membrane protein insertase [Streptomyces albireticuli]PAU44612.1 hypothetical protein CK936_33985 [Streptomyces albireticuli]
MSAFTALSASPFSSLFSSLGSLLLWAGEKLAPLFGASGTAVAVVLLTLLVRLALHPLARSAARGDRARAALAPRVAELRRKHSRDPERMMRAVRELHAKAGVSQFAGIGPVLAQAPVLFAMFHLFSTGSGGAELLDRTLLGTRLGGRWADALGHGGPFGAQGLVYAGLFVLVAAVATWTYRTARAAAKAGAAGGDSAGDPALPGMAGFAKVAPLLSFGMLVTVALVPLAAGLYLVTSSTWTAAERALLRGLRTPGPKAPAAGRGRRHGSAT